MPAIGPDLGDIDMTVALDITGTEGGDKRLKLHRCEWQSICLKQRGIERQEVKQFPFALICKGFDNIFSPIQVKEH